MFDTPIMIVGNVLTAPEWRRTNKTGTLVANFRVASTSRRFDRENGRWIDGDSLRVRVTCWRKLAENVGASLAVGDPVMVIGRLYTRDWTDSENNLRTSFELDASAVGHDLARGRTKLFRNRTLAGMVEGPETDAQVRGEVADLLSPTDVPIGYGEGIPDDEPEPQFDETVRLAGGGFEPFDTTAAPASSLEDETPEDETPEDAGAPEVEIEVEAVPAEPRRSRRTRREPVPA